MSLRVVQFLAILLTALALMPSGAHLFKLPNKIDLPRDVCVMPRAEMTTLGLGFGMAGSLVRDLLTGSERG
jgi:hypothetical protein